MSATDIIKKQISFVTAKDKMDVATHLEAAAKLLRNEAAVINHKTAFVKEKRDRAATREASRQKFSQAMIKVELQKQTNALNSVGFALSSENKTTGVKFFMLKSNSNIFLKIHGGSFSIIKQVPSIGETQILLEPTAIQNLKFYLESPSVKAKLK